MRLRNDSPRLDALRLRWKAVSGSHAFLIAALVAGVALLFGAPLLLAESEAPAGGHAAERSVEPVLRAQTDLHQQQHDRHLDEDAHHGGERRAR